MSLSKSPFPFLSHQPVSESNNLQDPAPTRSAPQPRDASDSYPREKSSSITTVLLFVIALLLVGILISLAFLVATLRGLISDYEGGGLKIQVTSGSRIDSYLEYYNNHGMGQRNSPIYITQVSGQ